jgi:hypothetical protein
MIERDLPIFIIELAPYALAKRGSSVEMLVENLLPLGYCFYCGPREKVLPKDPKLLSAIVPDWSSTNIVACVGLRAHSICCPTTSFGGRFGQSRCM